MPPEITTVGKLLNCLKRGELHGIVQVGASPKNVATRNLNALRALRQRAKGKLTAEFLERLIRQVLDDDDSNISFAGLLSLDLRGFIDALDKVAAKGGGSRRRSTVSAPAQQAAQSTSKATKAVGSTNNPLAMLLSVFTGRVSDKRFDEAASVVNDADLTANQKLAKIDRLIGIPAKASGEQLGHLLGVSKTAVQKTQWYRDNRKGERDSEIDRRGEAHRERGKRYERDRPTDDE